MGTIDTGNVTGRRELHFTDLAQLDADARALAEGDAAGKLHRLGNWSLGQALGHLAAWTNFGFDGYPMKVPFYIKAMIRPMKGRLLRGPIPAGKCIPNVAGGTFGTEAISTEEGLKKFLAANARLRAGAPMEANPLFGAMTHEVWIELALRHGELHLSFFYVG